MKKKGFFITIIFVAMLLTLTSCKKHNHTWLEATCTTPKTCSECHETEGVALGHLYDSECDEICNRCNEPRQASAEHDWHDATDTKPATCSKCGQTKDSSLKEALDELVPQEAFSKITLPTTVLDQYQVTWETLTPDVMLDDGVIVYNETPKTATMKATVMTTNDSYTFEYDILVTAPEISKGLYDYAYDYYKSKFSKPTGKDVTFITKDYNNCSVRYISLDDSIITSDGKITQTIHDQVGIIDVYVINDGIAICYRSEITILGFTAVQRVQASVEEVNTIVEQFKNKEISLLPFTEETYGCTLIWRTNIPDMLILEDVVLTPLVKTNLTLECTIRYENISQKVTYELTDIGGTLSEEEYLENLVKYLTRITLKGSINYVRDGGDGQFYFVSQERTNSYGVLDLAQPVAPSVNTKWLIDVTRNDFKHRFFGSGHLGTSYKPDVSQEWLDNRFYTGYQMPNEQNVLWIVVHETAMTDPIYTSEALGHLQYEYAFERDEAREASWNYQVDAYDIYQSFGDDVICWHASDGTYTAGSGNNNGIGIEMCVNQFGNDRSTGGNYEGTLANNAKLVASLMLQYNLTFDNVGRHYDFAPDKKQCPNYLIQTDRWEEFLEMVRKEYLVQKYLKGATVEYQLSTEGYSTTDAVLSQYFATGCNGLYYNKPVTAQVDINFKVVVTKDGKVYSANSIVNLLPDVNEE